MTAKSKPQHIGQRTLTIDVTAEDLANGKSGDCEVCPVALAAARTFPMAYRNVWKDGIRFSDQFDLYRRTYKIDAPGCRLIDAIDHPGHGLIAMPMTITLTRTRNDAR